MKDRRRFERFALELPAQIMVLSGERERETFVVVTSNVCAGGAFFPTTQGLPEGTEVLIELRLPNDRLKELAGAQGLIKIRGTVKRFDPSGMAICFDEEYEMTPLRTG